VLIGVALTVSIYGAFVGVPVLLVVARPWWACLLVSLGRTQPQGWSPSLRVHLVVSLFASTLFFGVAASLGLDDLDSWGDAGLWVAFGAMLISAIYGGVRLLRMR